MLTALFLLLLLCHEQTFLACLPEARQGGLLRISSALFHPNQNVRMYACLLLQRLETFESTRPAVFALNK